MSSMELEGMDELIKKIDEMGRKGTRIESQALKKAGEVIADEFKRTSAFQDKTGKLREGLKVSGIRSSKGVKHVLVGIQKGDNSKVFYGKFLEYGTSKMSAKPFMGPAYESKKKEAEQIIKDEIRKGLNI